MDTKIKISKPTSEVGPALSILGVTGSKGPFRFVWRCGQYAPPGSSYIFGGLWVFLFAISHAIFC